MNPMMGYGGMNPMMGGMGYGMMGGGMGGYGSGMGMMPYGGVSLVTERSDRFEHDKLIMSSLFWPCGEGM